MPLMKYESMGWFFSFTHQSHVNLLGKTVTLAMVLPLGALLSSPTLGPKCLVTSKAQKVYQGKSSLAQLKRLDKFPTQLHKSYEW